MEKTDIQIPLSEIDELRVVERVAKHLSFKLDTVLQPHISDPVQTDLMQNIFNFSNRLNEFHNELHEYISIKIAELVKDYGFDKHMYDILKDQIESLSTNPPKTVMRKVAEK